MLRWWYCWSIVNCYGGRAWQYVTTAKRCHDECAMPGKLRSDVMQRGVMMNVQWGVIMSVE